MTFPQPSPQSSFSSKIFERIEGEGWGGCSGPLNYLRTSTRPNLRPRFARKFSSETALGAKVGATVGGMLWRFSRFQARTLFPAPATLKGALFGEELNGAAIEGCPSGRWCVFFCVNACLRTTRTCFCMFGTVACTHACLRCRACARTTVSSCLFLTPSHIVCAQLGGGDLTMACSLRGLT